VKEAGSAVTRFGLLETTRRVLIADQLENNSPTARVLAGSREHPSAEQIHQAVRRRLPRLSLATVYKNLEALRAIGAVSDVNSLHEHGRYEAALPGTGAGQPHHRLVCVRCKRVPDLYDRRFDSFRFGAAEAQGFEVRSVRVQVEGVCPRCRTSQAHGR
jgi:Fe2+ or Zn2+ uptake regulation protein